MKNKMKIGLTYIMVLFYINTINAQNGVQSVDSISMPSDSLQQVMKMQSSGMYDAYMPVMPAVGYPTPTSMALQKYLGYPVSPATGLVDITVPLYEFKEKSISLPFQLKYHSSGIKIQDTPGIVGYGWTLHPGLKISRIIMGKPDDHYPVKNLSANPDIIELINMATPSTDQDIQGRDIPGESESSDGQYDLFTVYLANTSASFILKYSGSAYYAELISGSPLLIEPLVQTSKSAVNLRLYGLIVTDDFGNKYYFGEEVYKLASENPQFIESMEYSGRPVATGWMLRKIIQSNGEEISFTYTEFREYSYVPEYYYQILDHPCSPFVVGGGIEPLCHESAAVLVSSNGYTIKFNSTPNLPVYSKAISSINSNTKEMVFSYMNCGEFCKRLSNITVRDKLFNNQIKTISFVNKSTDSRFLEEVDISGTEKYLFDYSEFPVNYNYGIDWWGYCNGTKRDTGIPKMQITYSDFNIIDGKQETIGTDNREPSATYMQSGILKKITYPTGGTFEIDFEPHRANYYEGFELKNKNVGGLRVTQTRLYDPVSSKTIRKDYNYETPRSMTEYPKPEDLIKTSYMCSIDDRECYVQARSRVVTPFSPNAHASNTDCLVWYEKVTETINGGSEGKTVYTYDYKSPDTFNWEYVDGYWNTYPAVINNHFYTEPRLLTMTHYNKENNRTQKVENSYYRYTDSPVQGWIVTPEKRVFGGTLSSQCIQGLYNSDLLCQVNLTSSPKYCYDVFLNPIMYKSYTITKGLIVPASTETTTFANNDSTVERISYTYDLDKKYNMRSKTVSSNIGDVTEKYYYPYDNNSIPDKSVLTSTQQANITLMDQKNYKTTIIQQTVGKGNSSSQQLSPLFSKITGFMNVPNKPNLFLPETDYFQTGTNSFEPRIAYSKHDSYGNPLYLIKDSANQIVYLWSYKGQYPIAEIKNATFAEAEAAAKTVFSVTSVDAFSALATPNEAKLQDGSLQKALPAAQVTTYTYKPLIGMATMTDPQGITTYYDYDAFGRLKETYYYENNDTSMKRIVETFDYHYKSD